MNIFLSGYYGYANAGDEAVLASVLEHLAQEAPSQISSASRSFTVTSGDSGATLAMHGPQASRSGWELKAIGRQAPRSLLQSIRACDLFISGGGSLLQDVTSLRNVVYYTGLIRLARLSRKPVMIYAQGIGPLRHSLSRKMARSALQGVDVITVRDEASRDLLTRIGVTREIRVTADPVWALAPAPTPSSSSISSDKTWMVSLRSWTEEDRGFGSALFEVARAQKARLRFLPMQPQNDGPLIHRFLEQNSAGEAFLNEHGSPSVLDITGRHPREVVQECAGTQAMIAMRLHALIFAASRGVPCVAVNYDPKVEALARIIGAPCLRDLNDAGALATALEEARPLPPERLQELTRAARSNANLAWSLI